ncbi:hypothetical protein DSECCO2_231100 [anaerobic digester metagenome]
MISNSIIKNIHEAKLIKFIKSKGVTREKDDEGMDLHLWVWKIIDENKIQISDINEFLLNDLMYGKRRLIRYYELKNVRKFKQEKNWMGFLENYEHSSLNFNYILTTNLTKDEKVKIAAIQSYSENNSIYKVNILFVYNVKKIKRGNDNIYYSYSYLPVSLDLKLKTMIIKVWNMEDCYEGYTSLDQMEHIYNILKEELEIQINDFSIEPQQVLYKMSKDLFDDFFKQLPNVNKVEMKKLCLPDIIDMFLSDLGLKNVVKDINDKLTMKCDVINVEEEMYKLLQQVALYDYLNDSRIESLLENTDKHISRIRFNDRDNLTASLTSEKGIKCIFDTKTFMCIRNSLDVVENIVHVVLSLKKERGLLSVKYDASDCRYVTFHILHNRYYLEEDFYTLWGLYKEYEKRCIKEVSGNDSQNESQAM